MFFISVVVFLVIAFWGYLQTEHAQEKIIHFISKSVKENTGHDIKIGSVSFPLPFKFNAEQIELRDNEDLIVSIGKIELAYPFWNVFNNTYSLRQISLDNVKLHQLNEHPSLPPVSSKDSSSKTIWERLPYNLKLSSINVNKLNVDKSLLPEFFSETVFPINVHSTVMFNPSHQIANIEVNLKSEDEHQDDDTYIRFALQGSKDLSFEIDLLENDQGVFSHAIDIGIPFDTSVQITGKRTADKTYDGQYEIHFLNDDRVYLSERKLSGGFFFSRNGQLNLHSMQGQLGSFELNGEVLLNTADLKINESEINLSIKDLSQIKHRFKLDLSGSAEAKVLVKGTLASPEVNFKLEGQNFHLDNEPINNFLGEAYLTKSLEGLLGKALLNFDLRDKHFEASTEVVWGDEWMRLNNINADYGTAKVEGELAYIFDTHIYEGYLKALAEDASIFNTLFDLNIKGSGSLAARFFGIENTLESRIEQNMDITLEADKGHYAALRVEKAILKGHLRYVLKKLEGQFELLAQQGYLNGWRFDTLTAETKIEKNQEFWPFRFETNDRTKEGLAAKAEGVWHIKGDHLDMHLQKMEGRFKYFPFNLEKPFTLAAEPHLIDLSPVMLRIGQNGTFYTTIEYREDHAHTTTRLSQIPLEILYPPNFHVPFTGVLDGEANLFGVPGELAGHLKASLSKIKIQDEAFSHVSPFAIDLKGDIEKDHVKFAARIKDVTQKPIEVNIDLPVHASLNPPDLHFNRDAPLQGQLIADGEIAPLLHLLIIDTNTLTGQTAVDLKISGSFNNPEIAGTIDIKNGTFESSSTGAYFHDLHANMEARNKTLILKNLYALDVIDGAITGKGQLDLEREKGFPFDLDLDLTRIRLLNLDFAKAIASGKVHVTGGSNGAKVDGSLTTESLQVTIPEEAPALQHSVDVKYVNLKKGEVSPLFVTSRPKWPIELDININVPDKATITSKELSSNWKGGVKVNGFAHAPLLFGDFRIIKGEYNFNGKTFEIKEGTISFAGEPDKKTTLYVIASKDLGKIVAEVILKGSVKNPSIAFRSNPPMPQREILSYLLFGRGAGDITPFQGSELSQSIKDLTKGNKDPDVLTKIRDKIGIDRIDINKAAGSESDEVSLQVGKYISRNLFVSVNKSITSDTNRVGLEASLTRNIKCEAQVGDDASAQLQLKWKKDY
jgi:translocation and assembly module TamB